MTANAQQPPAAEQATRQPERPVSSRSGGRLLGVVRAVCLVVALLSVGLFVAALAPRHQQLLSQHVTSSSPADIMRVADPAAVRAAFAALHLPAEHAVAYLIALEVIFAAVYGAVAAVLFWRKADDWLALVVALLLVLYGTAALPTLSALIAVQPAWDLPVQLLNRGSWALLLVFFYLFPDGRFVPGWTRWLAVIWVVLQLAWAVAPTAAFNPLLWPPVLGLLLFMAWFSTGLLAQGYRYARVSTPSERQQTKWVLAGTAASVMLGSAVNVPNALAPAFGQPGHPGPLYELLRVTVTYLAPLLFPVSIGIAILRYRLWDIDLLINRTLVYGTLTGLLLAVYLGSVVFLQGLLRALTGQENNLAVVVSTLVAAALFQPLRSRLQTVIDRRFYRRKYDAARTLAAFSAALRDDVDLASLANELVSVVEETMQPAHVSLWLRPNPAPPPTPAAGGEHGRLSIDQSSNPA